MSIKVETRGKYPGVKIHLDAEEAQQLIEACELIPGHYEAQPTPVSQSFGITKKMGMKIKQLLAQEPHLLQERSPEQIAAILAKESEKAALQLEALKTGQDWKKIDPDKLQEALNKHVKK